jgi:ribonuclease BN (tRNA processing enzyme)
MKLTVLGPSGSFAGPYGAASTYLVEHGDSAILLDCGNGGLTPLAQHRDIYELDAVLLSHLHLDHFADIGGLYVARRYRPGGAPDLLPVFGPSDVAQRVGRMYAPRADEHDLADSFDFRPFTTSTVTVGAFTITASQAKHPVEAFSIKVEAGGKTLVYSGDTGVSQDLVRLATNADLLLVEASFLEGRPNPPDLHLTAREAVHHAAQAQAKTVVLTHLVPWNDINDTVVEAQRARDDFGYRGDLELARTGLAVEL